MRKRQWSFYVEDMLRFVSKVQEYSKSVDHVPEQTTLSPD